MVGVNEAVCYNESLNAGIAIAQQKFNIKGGETPMAKSIPVIKAFIKELGNWEMIVLGYNKFIPGIILKTK